MRCRDCSQVRRYPIKRKPSGRVASDEAPSAWSPREPELVYGFRPCSSTSGVPVASLSKACPSQ